MAEEIKPRTLPPHANGEEKASALLLLTARTEEGRAPALHNPLNRSATARRAALSPFAAIDVEPVLEIALPALDIGKVFERRAPRRNGVVQDITYLTRQTL